MKKKYIYLLIMIAFSLAVTPAAFRYAAACRGFIKGLGGEIFVPFSGLLIWFIWQELEQIFCFEKTGNNPSVSFTNTSLYTREALKGRRTEQWTK